MNSPPVWNSKTFYKDGDVVSYNGSFYVSRDWCYNEKPNESLIYWKLDKFSMMCSIYDQILKEKEKEIKDLKREIRLLRTHIECSPDGKAFLNAKEHFESVAK